MAAGGGHPQQLTCRKITQLGCLLGRLLLAIWKHAVANVAWRQILYCVNETYRQIYCAFSHALETGKPRSIAEQLEVSLSFCSAEAAEAAVERMLLFMLYGFARHVQTPCLAPQAGTQLQEFYSRLHDFGMVCQS